MPLAQLFVPLGFKPLHLEGLEDEITGIKRISASYRHQQMEVEYDETQVTEQQIIQAAQAHGYQAVPV